MNFNEIEQTVIEAKNGNMEAVLKLIEQFKPFIFKQAVKFKVKNMDTFDLVQIGYVALIKCIDVYDTKKHTFSSYVYSAIKNNIKYALRKSSKTNGEVSLNAPVDEEGANELINIVDSHFDLEDNFLKNERIKEVKKLLMELQEDELELIILCYYNDFSLKQYAEKKNVPYLQIVRLKNRIFSKLKAQLEKQAD